MASEIARLSKNLTSSPEREVTDGGLVEQKRYEDRGIKLDPHPRRQGEGIIAFGSALVGPGERMTLTARPIWLIRPRRFVVPSSIARDFEIVDIKIGHNSQLSTHSPISALLFTEEAIPLNIVYQTCHHAMDVSVTVENIGQSESRFVASMVGDIVE